MVQRLSKTLRQHHTSFAVNNQVNMKKENPTAVEWIDTRKIRFKVIVFKNNQMRKRDLIAELHTDSDGNFVSQPVDFSILHRRDKSLYQEEKF